MKDQKARPLMEALGAVRRGAKAGDAHEALKAAMRLAAALPPPFPRWLANAMSCRFDDLDALLDALPNRIELLYNESGRVCVMAPDLFLAHAGYERATARLPCAMVTKAHGIREDGGPATGPAALFVQADTGIPVALADFVSIILLCPARFTSAQLMWIGRQRRADGRVLLLDVDQEGDIPQAVRENDMRELEFLMARWEIEAGSAARDALLSDILKTMAAMTGEDTGDGWA